MEEHNYVLHYAVFRRDKTDNRRDYNKILIHPRRNLIVWFSQPFLYLMLLVIQKQKQLASLFLQFSNTNNFPWVSYSSAEQKLTLRCIQHSNAVHLPFVTSNSSTQELGSDSAPQTTWHLVVLQNWKIITSLFVSVKLKNILFCNLLAISFGH